MIVRCFDDLVEIASGLKKTAEVAVVEAHDENTLKSVIMAATHGIIAPKLIGNHNEIRKMLSLLGADASLYDIRGSGDSQESLKIAIDMVNSGSASALMKGKLETGEFIKAIVNKKSNLLTGRLLSLAGLYKPQNYKKVFVVSDIGLVMYPGFEEKKAIIMNAVDMLNALGVDKPKVAVLAAVEKVNDNMPETLVAKSLKNAFPGEDFIIEGPVSFDLATNKEAAAIKGYDSPIAGEADLLIVPEFVSGNILAKSLTGFGNSLTAGAVLGAKVPIMLTSRSAEMSDKFYSIALGVVLGAYAVEKDLRIKHDE